jgi:CubicO group peptidase (beta-lactamase class C family)
MPSAAIADILSRHRAARPALCAMLLAGCAAALQAQTAMSTANPVVPAAPAAADPQPDFGSLRPAMEEYIREAGLPGAGLLLIRDGKVIYREFVGRYSAETRVSTASAAKWLTGAVIMSLVDDDLIDLDAPIGTILPEFTGDKAQITVRQLMSHTSGLPGENAPAGRLGGTLADAAREIARMELVAKPGAEFRYGGVSMQVAARVAEVVSGKSWNELFEERIARPLGLTQTRYGRLGLTQNPQVAGGAVTTLDDYGRFVAMILARGAFTDPATGTTTRVLSEHAVREMCADSTRGASIRGATLLRRLSNAKYGIGTWVEPGPKPAAPDGLPHGSNSSPGAFGFVPWVDWERGVAGVFMIEDRSRSRRRADNLPDIRTLVRAALDAPSSPTQTPR